MWENIDDEIYKIVIYNRLFRGLRNKVDINSYNYKNYKTRNLGVNFFDK